ncbi:hypothetical protein [Mucilaginibacter sp. BT774]|uniref:hypothetical protein n=1 Tax=Mucilaginibacter sp. BT774 TaxID=3062276 RepID=UPI00267672BB|nr:hypothetical protein [Mucilaginibacter sp. BT774]MDO3627810.1 hypothetical protein [Mucilaginibacter sp. BT774]
MKQNLHPKQPPKTILVAIVLFSILSSGQVFAQQAKTDSTKMNPTAAPSVATAKTYPRAVGYLSFIVPVVVIDKNATTWNFNGTTRIGFPVGVNVLYSDHFGFSYEFTPSITATKTSSKVSNLLFDPGTMFRFEHGFTIISRLAFETAGRYGFTPVFNQVYARTKYVNYFIAGSLPCRFGNGAPGSIGFNVQFGFTFN